MELREEDEPVEWILWSIWSSRRSDIAFITRNSTIKPAKNQRTGSKLTGKYKEEQGGTGTRENKRNKWMVGEGGGEAIEIRLKFD